MIKHILLILSLSIIFLSCSSNDLEPVKVDKFHKKVDFLTEVKPILDRRCVVCHSCYNSPCQLKLSSYEGLLRGASKTPVYNALRLNSDKPTRLFVDAQSTKEWRDKGFTSVIDSDTNSSYNNSIILQLLDHKRKNPKPKGKYYSESDKLKCAKDNEELKEFLDENPHSGMPFGFPALKKNEFETIKAFIAQGSHFTALEELSKSSQLSNDYIIMFENFLNNKSPKHIISARYIYEHLFLAHLYFKGSKNEFYQLVRSKTAYPNKIKIIPSIRPYDDPKSRFYYRFKKITSTIVNKTHMTYELSDEKLRRYNELFIDTKWSEEAHKVDYKDGANPFITFDQIPARSRYKFLLDNSHYIIKTFIRGPVCKGQIALNVINDHFWVMFLDPKYDISINYSTFLKNEFKNLVMPIQEGSDMTALQSFSDEYKEKAIEYYKHRDYAYDLIYHNGLNYNMIFKGGDSSESSPILTVYRHFDSASVHKGVLGNLPRTMWVIDYPLFERIYYSLVAGFDVFGNIAHQTNVRRYMDRLRIEGETNFINFMPKDTREDFIQSWYLNTQTKPYFKTSNVQSNIKYKRDDPKREFVEDLVSNRFSKKLNIAFDKINYFNKYTNKPKMPKHFESADDFIQAFKHVSLPGTNFVKIANGENSNLAYIRFKIKDKEDVVISAVVNRWHDNVSFMFDETARLDSSKDTIDFIKGFVGSYPNYFIEVDVKDASEFFNLLENYKDNKEYYQKFSKFGIIRSNPLFWEKYDYFQKRFIKDNKENGLFDLNRYYFNAY